MTLAQHAEAFDLVRSRSPWGRAPGPEIQALCAGLTGLRGRTCLQVAEEVRELPFPTGIRKVRMFDADDGDMFATVETRTAPTLNVVAVSRCVTLCHHYRTHRWIATEALPLTETGVLDLAIRFKRRLLPLLRR